MYVYVCTRSTNVCVCVCLCVCEQGSTAGQHGAPRGVQGLRERLAALVAAEDWRSGAALEAEGLAAAAALQTALRIDRDGGGSVGLRFRRPKGSATGPFEIIAIDPHGPAELSGLGVCVCACVCCVRASVLFVGALLVTLALCAFTHMHTDTRCT